MGECCLIITDLKSRNDWFLVANHYIIGLKNAQEDRIMRVGIVFPKNPMVPPVGIDLVRLRALTGVLARKGWEVEVLAPVNNTGRLAPNIMVSPLAALKDAKRFDVVKTCYHQSIGLLGEFKGPVASRIVRVVDEERPGRDEANRKQLLMCQEMIRRRADALILNNQANAERWFSLYGSGPPVALIPTGCPARLPASGPNPYKTGARTVLFLGSLAAPRMIGMLNELAGALFPDVEIHHVGRNKAHMYGGPAELPLSPLIIQHGELVEPLVWDYIRRADVGLALAAGPDSFDNDLSKATSYLRGGLPVLSEERVLNNDLILELGGGLVFRYGDVEAMIAGLHKLINDPLRRTKDISRFMAERHSWDHRGEALHDLLSSLI